MQSYRDLHILNAMLYCNYMGNNPICCNGWVNSTTMQYIQNILNMQNSSQLI